MTSPLKIQSSIVYIFVRKISGKNQNAENLQHTYKAKRRI